MPAAIDPEDHNWFQRSVFYEVLVRGFYDSDDDGTGDLRGLTDKLDYLEWLGIDCIWLLPFYESPLRDGGYDISDFMSVLPAYGNVEDAAKLLDEAHSRGIRVIADMVVNHTSDAHPWFQESRSSRTNPKADWYVWSDDDTRWSEARIIFVDTEVSNWTHDAQRDQYYWHRFFHHQPDLNYDNPEVTEAMLDVVRFWLGMGLDGFRLDAVPYLFERDGTNGENLPQTHAWLKDLRRMVDTEFPGKVLLAEANQWPTDVVDYFGEGDECQMCFHFPLMPRMFMAARREQRYPITEILAQTPAIPEGCQWGIFLRNHDELTLEMVTDDERDYMYTEYAKDPKMRRNVGISRRLFPLLDNDRRLAELFHAMLFSMPGSPVLYYGDEIGMGDNIYLGDRDGVRTPMQWTPDRNAGFSKADFAQLYLPPLMDPVYGFQACNVEAELRDPSSFLRWMKRMLEVRHQHMVLGMGDFEVLDAENPSVLAYLRRGIDYDLDGQEDIVLCVYNLSRFAQPAELQLSQLAGTQPIELMGRVPFPLVGELPFFVTLPPYGFFWFALIDPGSSFTVNVTAENLAALVPDYLARQRWFAGEDVPDTVEVVAFELLQEKPPALAWMLVRVPGDDAAYQLLVGLRPLGDTENFLEGKGRGFLGDLESDDGPLLAYDAMVDPDLAPIVLAVVAPDVEVSTMRPLTVEQSNTSVVFDDAVILKIFRRVHDDPNPDVEVVGALAAAGYEHTAKPIGTWQRDGRDLGVAREYLAGGADGWHLALTSLRDLYDRRCPPEDCGGDFSPEATRLGEATGQLHVALANAFGRSTATPSAWADSLHAGLIDAPDVTGVDARYDALRSLVDAGAAIRIHGDLHLGQVLRTDAGWYVLDFEGEPRIPISERRKPSSPLRDVAGMLRSLHYAAEVALLERHEVPDDDLRRLADCWVARNRVAYLDGYLATEGIDELLPSGEAERDIVLDAFELGKAVYEVGYEREHRPEWERIPRSAIERLLV